MAAMLNHDRKRSLTRHAAPVLILVVLILSSGLLASLCGEAVSLCAQEWLTSALERGVERPSVGDWSAIRGLVVLGGQPERLQEALRLVGEHPHLRLVVSGPNDVEVRRLRVDASVRARAELDRTSRNTCGSAVFSAQLIAPSPGERWLLVTSSWHMPRSIDAFRAVGFQVEPWPVFEAYRPLSFRALVHEWVGLVSYRLRGCSAALLARR